MNTKERRIYFNLDVLLHYEDFQKKLLLKSLKKLVDHRFNVHLSRSPNKEEQELLDKYVIYYQVSNEYPKDNCYLPWEGVQRICQIENLDKEFDLSVFIKQIRLYLKDETTRN